MRFPSRMVVVAGVMCAPLSAAQSQVLQSLQSCLSSNVSSGHITLTNVQNVVNQQITSSGWVFACNDDVARKMWAELYPYRVSMNQWKDPSNRTIESFYFGNKSNCNRVVYEATGVPGTFFYCHVVLDLTDAVMQGLR
jgi:hypothetical protein